MATTQQVLALIIILLGYTVRALQQHIKYGVADIIIISENYPNPYPEECNVTWEWNAETGQWGVVFADFHLDSGSRDWLEIDDSRRRSVRYTKQDHPLLSYITGGPRLLIRFNSDKVTESGTRGFKLQVFYGANERELHIKLHEATKPVKKSPEADELSLFSIVGITLAASIAVAILVTALVVAMVNNRNKQGTNQGGSRNIFGVRRNSGISHSRSSPTHGHPPSIQQPQPPQQQRRPVQRSNSQLDWMARAELATSIQKAGCTPRPNDYTFRDIPSRVRDVSSKQCRTETNFGANNSARANKHATRSYESSLNEYSDTVDSLCHLQEAEPLCFDDGLHDSELPSYEESYSNQVPLQSKTEKLTNQQTSGSNAWSGKLHTESQTNIYINTGASPGKNSSIKEITIDASKCVIKSSCDDNLNSTKTPTAHLNSPDTKTIVYQNVLANNGQKCATSSSSVQLIDGYAFIVPCQGDYVEYQFPSKDWTHAPPEISCDITHGGLEPAQTGHGRGCADKLTNVYVNMLPEEEE